MNMLFNGSLTQSKSAANILVSQALSHEGHYLLLSSSKPLFPRFVSTECFNDLSYDFIKVLGGTNNLKLAQNPRNVFSGSQHYWNNSPPVILRSQGKVYFG